MKLQIIVGSTRPGRITERLAFWVAEVAGDMPDTEVEVVDLADYDLPFLDETISPQYNPNRQPNPVAKKWLDKLAEANAYIVTTPEYNRSYPAVLKNALDYIDFQIANKPVGLVAHGSSGGAQAVAHLRGVFAGLQTFTAPAATYFSDRVAEKIDEVGIVTDEDLQNNPYGPHAALKTTLDQVKWYSDALSQARQRDTVAV